MADASKTSCSYDLVFLHATHLDFLLLPGCASEKNTLLDNLGEHGGVVLTLTANTSSTDELSSDNLEACRLAIERRAQAIGSTFATARIQEGNQIVVYMPACFEPEDAFYFIGKPGLVEFARLDSFVDEEVRNRIDADEFLAPILDEKSSNDKSFEEIVLPKGSYTPLLDSSHIVQAELPKYRSSTDSFSVSLLLNEEGKNIFAKASKELALVQGKIVILLDGAVQTAPAVASEIPNGEVAISGEYTASETRLLCAILESGSFSTTFDLTEYEVFESVSDLFA